MDWISVDDKMPHSGQTVLVWLGEPEDNFVFGLVQVAHHLTIVNEWATETGTLKGVSHWMPLPPPPEDKYFEGIKFAADSVVGQYVPTDNFKTVFSFNIVAGKTPYKVFYIKNADGFWAFNSYEKR